MDDDIQRLVDDFSAAMLSGKLDDKLDRLSQIITLRKEIRGRLQFHDLKVGDKVRFSSTVNPKYLAGKLATVRDFKVKKVVVDLDDGKVGRFRAGITVPMSIIEKVG